MLPVSYVSLKMLHQEVMFLSGLKLGHNERKV